MIKKNNTVFSCFCLIIPFLLFAQVFDIPTTNEEENEWFMTINFQGETGLMDTLELGEKNTAEEGIDQYDRPEPPTPQMPYIQAFFITSLAEPLDRLMKEFKTTKNSDEIWNISVMLMDSNTSSSNITVSWDLTSNISAETMTIDLYKDTEIITNMVQNSQYQYQQTSNIPTNFRVVKTSDTNQGDTSDDNGFSLVNIILIFFGLIILVIIIVIVMKKINKKN